MPLYEFRCRKCDKKFETLVSFKDLENPVKCLHCDSEETERLLSTFCASAGNSSPKGAACSTGGT